MKKRQPKKRIRIDKKIWLIESKLDPRWNSAGIYKFKGQDVSLSTMPEETERALYFLGSKLGKPPLDLTTQFREIFPAQSR